MISSERNEQIKKDTFNGVELTPYNMGASIALGPFTTLNSGSRGQMRTTMAGTGVTPMCTELPHILSGFERQLAEHTFKIKVKSAGVVHSIHHKYSTTLDYDSIKHNPLIVIVYQRQDTGMYDVIELVEYHSNHLIFGSKLKINPIVYSLKPGTVLTKDLVLAESPNVKEGGLYSVSMPTNTAYTSHHATIEDGFSITDEFAKKAATLEITESTVSWGRSGFAINLYGDDTMYKSYPDIGDVVRPDGLISAIRSYNKTFSPIERSVKALQKPDFIFDELIYGIPGSIVTDIDVQSSLNQMKRGSVTPIGTDTQSQKYMSSKDSFSDGLLKTYDELSRNNPNLVLSLELHNMLVYCISNKPNSDNSRKYSNIKGVVRKIKKKTPIDEYRVVITTVIRKPLTKGAKLADNNGNKGVVVEIIPVKDAHRDKDGNIIHAIFAQKTPVSRLNVGQLQEPFINACSRDLRKELIENYGKVDNEVLIERLMGYYKMVSPRIYNSINDKLKHLLSVMDDTIRPYIAPYETHLTLEVVKEVLDYVNLTYDVITFTDTNGNVRDTVNPVLVGIKDMYVLDKTHHNNMSVSSSALQCHGLLNGPNKHSKVSYPSKVSAIRANAESETRSWSSAIGGETHASLVEMSNNPDVHKFILSNILSNSKPTSITNITEGCESVGNRSRSITLVNHILASGGIEIMEEK